MRLEKVPILRLAKLEINPEDHIKFAQASEQYMSASVKQEESTLFLLTGHEDEAGYKNYAISCFQDRAGYKKHNESNSTKKFKDIAMQLLTNHVEVELQPEFISTKPDKLMVGNQNDYVVYFTEIGVQLGKGDEFANGVLREMKTAVEKEEGIIAMIAGTILNQPNEWLSIEVYQNDVAYQQHLKTKHFKRYLEATKYCVESKGLHLLKPDCIADQSEIFYRP
ncbi:putative quinol monooxygenase [Lactobacillus kefiranofaciens]|uniref:Antibiotic biosynthesis monooxygenase n=1 Tax=Lactobacillus kefiranofaciens TaxID=267818 RepID=A0AAX3UG24_9LACO|nr:antibiotic biosynthesis monooxygenase [Lactobacillus kefiranofaciens]AEG40164.1 Hypothetical protein WANG_0469 [Lactobacillus kefiranofaciens subsp. kefiranofaciens]KRM23099.1 hypothetical protein FC93_GL000080 [Lactobacillus kefiranofaciens subsp. kefiranofaciens DSM 5016 = JCM 6985]MCJ2171435.1 antibiotic biosynthesis monooxygenase [Lactobacillus kefiranofaciens]MDF4141860.1 antibiotic biosynthesis monooxygenase [Lactobacillus kefiranofaciens]QFQ67741.1 antibiotic biosynthesis monooxygena